MNTLPDKITNTQMIPQVNDYLLTWIEGFLIDRKARGLTENTLLFYTRKLKQFNEFSETQAATRVSQLDANLIRQYLLWMETTGHNQGGVLSAFRAVKSFLLWYETETDEITAIHKVKAPRVDMEPLEGVSLETVKQMVKVCEHGTFTGDRDTAILYAKATNFGIMYGLSASGLSEQVDIPVEEASAFIEAYFAKYPGRFPLVHVKDRTASGQMVDVGQGTIDWGAIFAHRKQAGMKHEFVEHDEPGDPFASIAASYDYLRALRFPNG